MVNVDEGYCFVEYITDVDGGSEVVDKVGVMRLVKVDEGVCLLECTKDVDSDIEVADKVKVV